MPRTEPASAPSPTAAAPAGRPHRLASWLAAFRPAPLTIDWRERLRVIVGVALVVFAVAVLCSLWGAKAPLHWIIPPIAASALLIVGLPASPLAQPWPVLAGTTLSALIGVACERWIAAPDLAATAAVALAIGAMLTLRCLHPPGAATALMMVAAGVDDLSAAFFPVLVNAALMVGFGMAYNNATGRRYPHVQRAAPEATPAARSSATEVDIDAVLARYNQLLDVSRDDLQALFEQTEAQASERRLAETRCADIMSRAPKSVHSDTPLQQAWTLLRRHRIKALPVVDGERRVVGVISLTDFLRSQDLDQHEGFTQRLRGFIRSRMASVAGKPELVGQLMTAEAVVVDCEQRLTDVLPLFVTRGHHHVPVIDGERRLVGMLTQSDVMAALAGHIAPPE